MFFSQIFPFNSMGFKNLFNRKTKKPTEKGIIENPNPHPPNTTPFVVPRRANSFDSRQRIDDELKHVFNKFDVNGDGKISSSELGFIMETLGHRQTEDELEKMIIEVDSDGDGFIDLQEFIELNTKGIDSTELLENLKNAFSVFDVDKNGEITADELLNVLCSLGEKCTIGECRNMIAGVDRDGDGMISFDEFKVMMMNGSRFGEIEL